MRPTFTSGFLALMLFTLSACGGDAADSSPETRAFTLGDRAGHWSQPHPYGEPATVGISIGERLTIKTEVPVRWRIEYAGQASHGFGRSLQFSTLTVEELTLSNPSSVWSADLSGIVPQGGYITFSVVAETSPETVFDVNVR